MNEIELNKLNKEIQKSNEEYTYLMIKRRTLYLLKKKEIKDEEIKQLINRLDEDFEITNKIGLPLYNNERNNKLKKILDENKIKYHLEVIYQ